MSDLPKYVRIFEEGPREGFQIEKKQISTADKIRLINALSRTGVTHIQCVSFVDPRRVPGMVDAEAVVRGIDVVDGVDYSALWMNTRGLEQALAIPHLKTDGKIRIYPSEAFLRSNLGRTPEENAIKDGEVIELCKSRGVPVTHASVSSAFGCNFQGDIPISRVLQLIGNTIDLFHAHEVEMKELCLADTMAWANPEAIKAMVGNVREKFPHLALRLHLHDTRGMGLANAYAGLQMGVDRFDSSVAGLGGCPFAKNRAGAGNICTEDFVLMCEELGIEEGIDLSAMIEASVIAEEIVGHSLPGKVAKAGGLAELRHKAEKVAQQSKNEQQEVAS